MTPIDKRKAELREYIRKQEVEAEYLKDLSANKSAMSYYENARIAEQLLECIEALECYCNQKGQKSVPTNYGQDRRINFEYYADKTLNKIAGEE